MSEQARRKIALDLPEAELDALLRGAEALTRREISAAQTGPVFERPPSGERVRALLEDEHDLPWEGEPVQCLLERCSALLRSGRRTAPTFFGYVLSPPEPVGIAGDLLASAADQNVTSWRSAPVATELERSTIRWLGQFVGFSSDASGLLLSGGSAANLSAMLAALRARASLDADRRSMVVYTSEDAHFSVSKAAAVLGVAISHIPVDADRRLDTSALAEVIAADTASGRQPFCVIATAGSTATGAIDPLRDIASLARERDLWLHVDGAYGAPAAAVQSQRHRFAGLELADSLCIDAHKWLYAPLDCGALLLKQGAAGFSPEPDRREYVRVLGADQAEQFAFWDHGLELSRRFRALKLWMIFRYHGARKIAAAIAEDIEMAAYMAAEIRRSDDLELLTEPSLSICCFRHRPPELDEPELDSHNERLLGVLQREGSVYLSNANVSGRFALRACITNFRTTPRDVDRTLEVVRALGRQLLRTSPT